MPTPIEQMIDKATGYKPSARPTVVRVIRRVWRPIRCEKCGKHRRVFIASRKPHRVLCTACLKA